MSTRSPFVRNPRARLLAPAIATGIATALLCLPVLAPDARALGAPYSPTIKADSLVPITIRFRGIVDTAAFHCGTRYGNIGTSRATIVASDFRFYVSDVRLVTARGDTVRATLRAESPWQDNDVALVDFEDGTASCANGTAETRDAVVVLAPVGDYRGVAFSLGVPFARNHGELAKAPPPLSLSALFWAWQSGHKFLRVDMRATAADSAPTPWVIHLGSTGCVKADPSATGPVSCGHPNRATIALTNFDPSRDVVVADLASLLARSDVRRNEPKTAAGCMSAENDADCGGLFASLGLPHPAAAGAVAPPFFRVQRVAQARAGAVK